MSAKKNLSKLNGVLKSSFVILLGTILTFSLLSATLRTFNLEKNTRRTVEKRFPLNSKEFLTCLTLTSSSEKCVRLAKRLLDLIKRYPSVENEIAGLRCLLLMAKKGLLDRELTGLVKSIDSPLLQVGLRKILDRQNELNGNCCDGNIFKDDGFTKVGPFWVKFDEEASDLIVVYDSLLDQNGYYYVVKNKDGDVIESGTIDEDNQRISVPANGGSVYIYSANGSCTIVFP